AAQQSQSLEALLTHIPGLKGIHPSTSYDAKGLLLAALDDPNPDIFYEHKLLYNIKGHVLEQHFHIPISQEEDNRNGPDLTIVATSIIDQRAIIAAKELAKENISLEIIDPRTLVPLDKMSILESVKKTGHLLIVHEAVKRSGYGAEIASMVAEKGFYDLKAPIRSLGGHAVP